MKSIFTIALALLVCTTFNEALKCYSHDTCSTNCPQLTNSIKTCEDDNNKCYKAAFPGGVTRGCAKERCNVQVNANAVLASLCCETDLCNSAMKSKLTLSTFLAMISAFIWARM